VTIPFTNEDQVWCARAHPRYTLTRQIWSQSVYSVALWQRKTQNFAVSWTSAFCGVATWQQSEKSEHRCTTTNLPLSNGIKIVSVLQRLHGEIGCTNSDVQKRDGQTNKQTDKKTQEGGTADPTSTLSRQISSELFIVSASGGQKPQFWANFDIFGGSCTDPPFTDEGQIWCARADPRSTLTCQISSECVHCVGFRWPKNHNFGQILTFLGAPRPTPVLPMRAKYGVL